MKAMYNSKELEASIYGGVPVAFPCHPTVRVSVQCKNPPLRTVEVKMSISVGDRSIGIVEKKYPSMGALLEAFQIDDLAEIWEVLQ